MTIDAYQRVHAAVRRRWGSHQDARDAASEAYARWLANPADKTAHDVRSHVRYMVMHAGQILSPTGRRAAGSGDQAVENAPMEILAQALLGTCTTTRPWRKRG